MKYKILIIIFLSTLFTALIYFWTDKDNLNILALGDGISTGMTPYQIEGYNYNDYLKDYLQNKHQLENYYKNFNEIDETASHLLSKINSNLENSSKTIKIKQAIKEADIITISLGMDELNNYARKNYLGSSKINGFLAKYDEVLKEIRKLNNKKIYLLSLYKTNLLNDTKVTKLNQALLDLSKKYKVTFVDITDITTHKDFFLDTHNYYLNYKGQEFIFQKIQNSNESTTFQII